MSVLCLLALPALASASPKRSLTLEDIFSPDAEWDGVSLQSLQWEADGSAFLYVDADLDGKTKSIYRENVAPGMPSPRQGHARIGAEDTRVPHGTAFAGASSVDEGDAKALPL